MSTSLHASPIIKDGLVFYIDSYNPKSYYGASIINNMFIGNYGTLTNGVGFDGKNLSFDGVNDYIDFGVTNITSGNDLTIDLVLNMLTDPIGQYNTILDYNVGGLGFILRSDGTNAGWFYFAWWSGVGPYYGYEIIYFILPVGQYLHLSVTKSSTNVNIYIDGVPTYTWLPWGSFNSGTITATGLSMAIGDAVSGSQNMNALLNNLKIYDRALSDDEVKQNYNALKNRFI